MKNLSQKRKYILLALHFYVFVSSVIVTYIGVTAGAGSGQNGDEMIGLGYFKGFTMDSNIFGGLVSLVVAIYMIKNIKKKQEEMPYYTVVLQFISATAVGLTFLVAATFLAPKHVANGESYFVSFSDDMFFFHFLNPMLICLGFIFGEKQFTFRWKENLYGLIPGIIYSVVYEYFVCIKKSWGDFYGFTFGGKKYAVIPVSLAIYSLSFIIY